MLLDTTLAWLDENGRELEFIDDYYIFKDPHLSFRAPRAGRYCVQVAASKEVAEPHSSYRLFLGEFPVTHRILPLGARRGTTSPFTLYGINLHQIQRIVLGESGVQAELLESAPERLSFRLAVPADFELGRHYLRVEAAQGEAPFRQPILIPDLPEQLSSAPHSRRSPEKIQLPVALRGVLDQPRAAEFFSFRASAGERIEFDVQSMRLNYPLDPVLALSDAAGKQLAYLDEPAPNGGKQQPNLDPYLVHEFEQDGHYVVMILDSSERGQTNYTYRLQIRPVLEPSFVLKALTSTLTLFRGKKNFVPLRVRRLGGWTSPVQVWMEPM